MKHAKDWKKRENIATIHFYASPMWIKIQQLSGIDKARSLSGIMVVVMGIITVISKFWGAPLLFDAHPGYIPMASTSAIAFLVFGVVLTFNFLQVPSLKVRSLITSTILFITLYGLLRVLEFFLPLRLSPENLLSTHVHYLGTFPLERMSPYTGFLFFISGCAMLMKTRIREQKGWLNLVSFLGVLVTLAGFVATLGYLFGTPFLYSGSVIPLAASTAVAFTMLGIGLITLGGESSFLVNRFTGRLASARILRVFLPFLVLGIVANDLLNEYISKNYHINQALVSALITLVTIFLAIFITVYLTKIVFQSANKAELERLKAEKALEENLEFSNTLLRSIPFAMDMVDEKGTILFQSEKFKQHFPSDVTGKRCWEVYRDDHTQCPDCPLNSEIRIGETETRESSQVLGGRFFEITHTGLMHNGKKAVLEIFHDVTERRQSELRLKQYAEELKSVNSTKDRLFSIIAHDLKSPFNAILGLTQLLNEQYESFTDDERKKIVRSILEASQNTYSLMENLLTWSMTQRDGIKANRERIDLHLLAQKQLDVFSAIALSKEITLENHIPADSLVLADYDMVKTIFLNLINNAVKFTRPGGLVKLTSQSLNNHLEISVTDSGVGIADDVITNLFNPNENYTSRGTSNEKGTGLGLLVCKQFAEINGGTISVESTEGKGSRFTFTLPAYLPLS